MYIKIDLWEKQKQKQIHIMTFANSFKSQGWISRDASKHPSQHRQADHRHDSEGCLGNEGLFYLLLLISRVNERLTFRRSRVFGVLFWKKRKMQRAARFHLWILFAYTIITWSCFRGGVKPSQWKHSVIRLREYKTLALHCPDQARKALVIFFFFSPSSNLVSDGTTETWAADQPWTCWNLSFVSRSSPGMFQQSPHAAPKAFLPPYWSWKIIITFLKKKKTPVWMELREDISNFYRLMRRRR